MAQHLDEEIKKRLKPATPDFRGEGFGDVIDEKGKKYYPKTPLRQEIKKRMVPIKKKPEIKEDKNKKLKERYQHYYA